MGPEHHGNTPGTGGDSGKPDPLAILRRDFRRTPDISTLLTQGNSLTAATEGAYLAGLEDSRAEAERLGKIAGMSRAEIKQIYAQQLEGIRKLREGNQKKAAVEKKLERLEAIRAYNAQHYPDGGCVARVEYYGKPVTKIMSLLRHLQETDQLLWPEDTAKAMAAHWFDFRAAPTSSTTHIADFAEKMVDDGLMGLPFPGAVFVFTVKSPTTGALMTVAEAYTHDERGIWSTWALYIPHEGAPAVEVGHPEFQESFLSTYIFELLGLLDCRAMEAETARWDRRPMQSSGDYKGNAYTVLTLGGSRGDGEGTGHHAAPRLHWRRGHVRRCSSGKIVPVRPHLVGCADRGIIVKDYAA